MKRALIVIDVQNEYIHGKLPIAYPPIEESLQNITNAMNAAEKARIPIIVVAQIAPEQSPIFAKGSNGALLHTSITEHRYDHYVEKTLPSAFTNTDLQEWLTAHAIDTITITGYMTQNCDESTARDAVHRNFQVEFLSDATGTLALSNEAGTVSAQTLHTSVLTVMQSRFAAVATTEQWIAAVHKNVPLLGSSIIKSTAIARTNTPSDSGI